MPHPLEFYKYLTPEAAETVLSTESLRWSSPLLFDDPSEFRRMPRFEPTVDQSYHSAVGTLLEAAKRGDAEFPAPLSPTAAHLYELFCRALQCGVAEAKLRGVSYPAPTEA